MLRMVLPRGEQRTIRVPIHGLAHRALSTVRESIGFKDYVYS